MTYHWRLPTGSPDDPPEYDPDDTEAQRIAELFADALAEMDADHE